MDTQSPLAPCGTILPASQRPSRVLLDSDRNSCFYPVILKKFPHRIVEQEDVSPGKYYPFNDAARALLDKD